MRRQSEQMAQQEASDHEDDQQSNQPIDQGLTQNGGQSRIALAGGETDKDQDWGDQNVLKQQHAKRCSTDRPCGPFLLGQDLHDNRGG